MAEVRGVICDFGGVLTTPLFEAFLPFQDEVGVAPEDFGEALRRLTEDQGENPLFRLERGEISEVDFAETLSDGLEPILGHRPHMHRFSEIMFEGLHPNLPMIELIGELKESGLKTAMLTNNVKEWEPRWRPMLPVDEIFEDVIDSAFVGCRKPEPEIYAITLERIGLPAENCVFIDDLQPNIDAAREIGLQAVQFRDNAQAIAEVRAALAP